MRPSMLMLLSGKKRKVAAGIEQGRTVAALTTGALIIPETQVAEGVLVKSIGEMWLRIAQELGADWTLAFKLSARQWEEIVAGAYDKEGYTVTLTPRSGDHGRDIIAVKNGVGCVRLLGSVKAYKPDHLVGREHVHEMLGVISGDLGATKGIITTMSDFAPRLLSDPGLAASVPYRLELINGTRLQEWLLTLVSR